MEKARVAIIEDSFEWRYMARNRLLDAGHTIVEEAETLPDAINFINRLGELRKLGHPLLCDVILLDGNLGNGSEGQDAKDIFNLIESYELRIAVLGFSTFSFGYYGINIPSNFDTEKSCYKMLEAIESI